MSDTYPAELRLYCGGVPPGWTPCDGTALPISQYPILFAAIGRTYGGDATTFNVPDLRGCAVVGAGASYALGETGGEASVVLEISQIPAHTHEAVCSRDNGSQPSPANAVWAVQSDGETQYAAGQAALMASGALQTTGDREGHPNMQPYLALVYAIATGT